MIQALFSPLRIGAFELSHRMVMAPLTRMRASQPVSYTHLTLPTKA